jgi:thymidylate synthase (FAD)
LDNIKVILKHVTPEFVVNEAVGMPYDTPPSFELTGKVIGIKKHLSVAEHIVMNWHVIGASRLELQEHMRHRMASPTVQSTRYVLKKMLDSIEYSDVFVSPDLSALPADKAALVDATVKYIQKQFFSAAKDMRNNGIPNDYIKYIVPESLRTSFSWTINLRSFINFLQLRTDKHAHFEIRHIARLMRAELANKLESQYVDELLHEMGL